MKKLLAILKIMCIVSLVGAGNQTFETTEYKKLADQRSKLDGPLVPIKYELWLKSMSGAKLVGDVHFYFSIQIVDPPSSQVGKASRSFLLTPSSLKISTLPKGKDEKEFPVHPLLISVDNDLADVQPSMLKDDPKNLVISNELKSVAELAIGLINIKIGGVSGSGASIKISVNSFSSQLMFDEARPLTSRQQKLLGIEIVKAPNNEGTSHKAITDSGFWAIDRDPEVLPLPYVGRCFFNRETGWLEDSEVYRYISVDQPHATRLIVRLVDQ